MLSKKDIALLREMFEDQDLRFDQKLHDLRLDVRDEIHSCISASEKRMMKYINDVKAEIIDGITDTLDEFVFPQILELQTDMARVNHHLHMT